MILVVDDDLFLVTSIRRLLVANNFSVESAHRVDTAWQMILANQPDLLILDLSLPDGDGNELCQRIRTQFDFPILMLTSRSDSIDKVTGLGLGADDYLTKPFDPSELIARIQAILRRTKGGSVSAVKSITVGNLSLSLSEHEFSVEGNLLALTHTEFNLLAYLTQNSSRAVSREELFRAVWGYEAEFASNTLDVLVYRVRTKLKVAKADHTIGTIRSHGFRLKTTT